MAEKAITTKKKQLLSMDKNNSIEEMWAYNRGLENSARIVENNNHSKRRSVADLIRREKIIP